MCTVICDNKLFGRTLDLEYSYDEKVVTVPRNYKFRISEEVIESHPAIIGVAHVCDEIPLFYDAINELGLGVAGLNFPGNAVYHIPQENKNNIASFEVIPWILCKCESVDDAEKLLSNTVITNRAFSASLQPTPLHWLISDKNRSITVESTDDGLKIYNNPFGVMTNNPPFPYHMTHISDYLNVDSNPSKNTLCPSVELDQYSRGMGGIGLPGDYSSASRFVRAVFAKNHTSQEKNKISRFFHIMETVSVPKGCVKTCEGRDVYSVYTSCADMEDFAYYFITYGCKRIKGVTHPAVERDGKELKILDMDEEEDISLVIKR